MIKGKFVRDRQYTTHYIIFYYFLDEFYTRQIVHSAIIYKPNYRSASFFYSWANQSLLFLLDAACLAEKQQIPML
jgi:hypothetical protein